MNPNPIWEQFLINQVQEDESPCYNGIGNLN